MKREINWTRLLLAFLIATFLFSLGIFLGFLAKGTITDASVSLQEGIRNDIINLETLYLLEDSFPCNEEIITITSQKLDYLGELITTLEVKRGKDAEDVLELKKLYTILEIRHFLLTETRNEKCSGSHTTFLFFYSNDENCEGEVEKASFVLTFLRNKYDNIRVYSFDINLNSEIITTLKSEYNIKGCSGVVMNKEKIPFKVTKASQIEELF